MINRRPDKSLPKKNWSDYFSKIQFLGVVTLSQIHFGLSLDHLAAVFILPKTQDCGMVLGAKKPEKTGKLTSP